MLRFVSVFTASLVDLWCLVAIETTLKWNKITGIYNLQSTGQFIPLIIGIGGVLSVMLSLLGIYLEKSEVSLWISADKMDFTLTLTSSCSTTQRATQMRHEKPKRVPNFVLCLPNKSRNRCKRRNWGISWKGRSRNWSRSRQKALHRKCDFFGYMILDFKYLLNSIHNVFERIIVCSSFCVRFA